MHDQLNELHEILNSAKQQSGVLLFVITSLIFALKTTSTGNVHARPAGVISPQQIPQK